MSVDSAPELGDAAGSLGTFALQGRLRNLQAKYESETAKAGSWNQDTLLDLSGRSSY